MQTSKLIYDVGMHRGEDTEFYLSRGFQVVGIEANPTLVEYLTSRFAREISQGKVHIVGKAISNKSGKVRFVTYPGAAHWGTIDNVLEDRNRLAKEQAEVFDVECVTFSEIIKEFGIPYYLKIDIEGMDMSCIPALRELPERPRYISVESAVTSGLADPAAAFDEIAQLWVLGYRSFKYVDQAALFKLQGTVLDKEGPPIKYNYLPHSSGPFGEESPGEWLHVMRALSKMKQHIRYQNTIGFGGQHHSSMVSKMGRRLRMYAMRLPCHSWYDLHARL